MTKQRTRCPKCSTAFYITDAQLQQANGYVRCGSCLEVFEASLYLEQVQPKAPRAAAIVAKPKSPRTKPQQTSSPAPTSNTTAKLAQSRSASNATSTKAASTNTKNSQKPTAQQSAQTSSKKATTSAATPNTTTSLSQAAQAAHQGVNKAIRNKTSNANNAQLPQSAPTPKQQTPKQEQTTPHNTTTEATSNIEVTAEDQWISDLIAELESNKADTENKSTVQQAQADIAPETPSDKTTNAESTVDNTPSQTTEQSSNALQAQPITAKDPQQAETSSQVPNNPKEPAKQPEQKPKTPVPKAQSNAVATAQNKTLSQAQFSEERATNSLNQPVTNSASNAADKASTQATSTASSLNEKTAHPSDTQTKADASHTTESTQVDSHVAKLAEADNLKETTQNTPQETSKKTPTKKEVLEEVTVKKAQPENTSNPKAVQTHTETISDEINNEAPVPSFLVEKKGSKGVLWFVFSTVAAGVLFAQYLFWNFEKAAYSQTLRPLLVQSCKQLHCIVPVYENLAQLRAEQFFIRPVPNNTGQVQIDALIVNTAAIEQRFPTLRIQFQDNMSKTVNQIDIAPEQYLTGDLSQLSAMPAQTPIHIQLNVAHEAPLLGYQLQFISS